MEQFEFFEPPERIKSMIASDEKYILNSWEAYPFFSSVGLMEREMFSYCSSLHYKVETFYKLGAGREFGGEIKGTSFGLPNLDVFRNWISHSSGKKSLVTGLFMGDRGVCTGFQDKGFFCNEEIKNKIENRTHIDSQGEGSRLEGSGFGYKNIYRFVHHLEVDSDKGVLYLANPWDKIVEY